MCMQRYVMSWSIMSRYPFMMYGCCLLGCIALALCTVQVASAQEQSPELRKVAYNHPGLVVDLGVGLWAWPCPCDADGDGDFDLIVSCPDKPSNGIWLFENTTGTTKRNKFPVFKPGRKLSRTVHYVMPSYHFATEFLSPGLAYPEFLTKGTDVKKPLRLSAGFYKAEGPQTKGPKVRHNQWRLIDFDGDTDLDLITGIEDWSYYGWDDAAMKTVSG